MSYQNYPGLAESPPPSAINSSCTKNEPLDSDFNRGGGGWKRQSQNASSDSWAPKAGVYSENGRFLEMSRHDSPASSAAFYRQSTATSTNNFQEHYSHGSNSSAVYFQEEFRGPFPTDSSLCAFPADFRSLHPRTKSRFDEIVDDGHGQPVPMSSDTADFRARRICGDAVGTEIQMGDQMAMVPTQSTPMEQPNCHQQHDDVPKSGEHLTMNREFYRPTTPSSTSVPKKRTFAEISGFDSLTDSAHAAAKVSRIALISYPAAPPAVLKSYTDDRRYTMCHLQQNERQNPLEIEAQNCLLDLRQELAFVDSLDPSLGQCLTNSRRLLISESMKLEEWHNPDWVEVDHNRPVKLSKQILIPNFRYPSVNFIGRIVGFKGSTLSRICRKYKCFISILGANSTKDRQQEIELLQSGDYRYAHYASPLHIRIDVIAPTHLAHMRMAGVLNFFHKLLVPNRDFDVDAELADVDLSDNREKSKSKSEKMQRWAEEERRWETEFDEANTKSRTDGRQNYRQMGTKTPWVNGTERRQNGGDTSTGAATFAITPSPPSASSSVFRGGSATRARGGGFVPRMMRPRGNEMNG
ncbi:hypothetical protein niasHT_020207 [Heterodera trifolii]|uniref:K Homology domain-containing protein n=1 Tax=Heterodera trifolii TaxID=157864 RepID=A0ABD2JGM0_9BILA